MAFLTTDRMGRMKANPPGTKENFLFAGEQPIFAHSLAAVLNDGTISSLNDGADPADLIDVATIKRIVYADERLAPGTDNARTHTGGLDADSGEALSDVYVYLDVLEADNVEPGNEGDAVYAVDDHTVSISDDTGARAYVGTIEKVVNGTLAIVYVPGLKNPVAA